MTDDPEDVPSEEELSRKRFSIDERFDFRLPPEDAAERQPAGLSSTVPGHPPGTKPPSWKAPSAGDPLLGQHVGNYEVVQELGRGGFGTVYKAHDIKLDRFVALKFLRFPLDSEYRKLFAREAQVLANLSQDPHIVQIYTWGEYQGSYYFALEYLDTSAAALLEKSGGRLVVRRALEIVEACAAGLQHAHNSGVLHRDVKPANILIDSKTNRAKLCDFGLAKFQGIGAGTVSMHVAGSPPYMAPEQILGGKLDARTDVYGLGVTLYELLSGRLPFEGSSQAEIVERIRAKKATPLSAYRPDLAPAVRELVERAMKWEARDRFQTAAEFRQAAERLLAQMDSSGLPEPARPQFSVAGLMRRRAVRTIGAAAIALLVVVAAIGVWGIAFKDGRPDSIPGAWPIAMADARELIDSGKYAEAKAALEAYLKTYPNDDFGKYALGFTHYLLGNQPDAEAAFNGVGDPALKLEGLSAVRRTRENEGARPSLEEALKVVPTRYPALLLASLDILKGDYPGAVAHLQVVEAARLNFEWQRQELHRLLGQAYYKTGAVDLALGEFRVLPAGDLVAAGYLELARSKQKAENREALRQHIKELRANWDASGIAAEQDTWTSRPMTLRLEPIQNDGSAAARASVLVDLLPTGIQQALDELSGAPIQYVARESIDAIQEELNLDTQLGSEAERLAMRQLIAARLTMGIEFRGAGEKPYFKVQVDSTESTKTVLSYAFDYTASDDYITLATRIVAKLADNVSRRYPIKAKLLLKEGQPVLNVGTSVGVKPGMRFTLRRAPEIAPMDGRFCVTLDGIQDALAPVRLEGLAVVDIPGSGLYAEPQE
jgi:tetratricopeptide (TPR) repeat protein